MRIGALIVVAGLLSVSPVAFAQRDTEVKIGSHISRPRRAEIPEYLALEERERNTLADFARCVIDQNPRGVAAYVGQTTIGDDKALSRLVMDECVSDGMPSVSLDLFRGAIHGQLYKRHQNPQRKGDWAFPIVGFDLAASVPADASMPFKANLALMAFSDCIHRSKPAEVESVVLHMPGTKEQNAAFTAIIPHLGVCIPKGQTIKLNGAMLEATFGEYLYRSLAPAPAATSGSNH